MMKGPRIYNSLSPEERVARLRKKQEKREKEVHRVRRNRIIAAFLVLFAFLGIQLAVTHAQTNRINEQVQTSKKSLKQINNQKKILLAKRDDLKDPDYVAKLVRFKFLYSKPNETVYNLPEDKDNN
ncbi:MULTISPECIES: FtsB family cell division protein [Lactobacillus]|uniref:Septum formation initiator family protein n=1 Tax=Lactobacillus panisapium TaxID=2012495 RepID=A0ABX8W7U2_9LACO|nr:MULTISPECIES: septum formation initiator family protein [Lactobacillus]MCT6807231.1 septum formation initiator family protein [Bombilactobacillus sp.]MCO6531070.1 septum formation initiator family protein [Lactobacillus sp.]MCO6533497.1 septum formation initiator family protein [Lactobacillus sp.]MCO6534668.1 septum formation initiator family protein [Lactobacillus sp.]MCT6820810.1 septum formation initiator family protein [Lactobacillus panisapium]